MSIVDLRNHQETGKVVEPAMASRSISRRQFLQGALAVGVGASAASAVLTACGGGGSSVPTVTSISALTEWSGGELDAFKAILAEFKKRTKIDSSVESSRDLPTILSTRVKGNNPPDICGMPSLSTFHDLASKGKLVQLDTFFDMTKYNQSYTKAWTDLASYNGKLYAVLPKANSKGTIWYNPTAFQATGATIPATWSDLISVSDKIATSGKYPWSVGVESAASSGWPAADWIDQIYLSQNGPDLYDKWVAHKIPWTHSSIKSAFQAFGQIVHGKNYVNGGADAILATNFQDSTYLPYDSPPKAYMCYLGDFAAGFITKQFPGIQPVTGYNFFPFPTINTKYKNAFTGSADIMVAMKDNNGTRQFMEFMSTADAQSIWVKRGGATSANKGVNLNLYPDDVTRNAAKLLTQANFFKLGADDLMPQQVENAFWAGTLTYIKSPDQLDSILSGIETIAQQAYPS